MTLHHVGVWARNLEVLREFYCRWFDAAAGEKYVNAGKRFESYLLSFPGGGKLELMRKAGMAESDGETFGYAHFAVSLGSEAAVDGMALRLKTGGVRIVDGPRKTGDGFYECALEDPEGNRVEITA